MKVRGSPKLLFGALAGSLAISTSASAAFVVIPNVNEETPGPSNQAFPFNRGVMRYQQVYAADQFQGLRGVIKAFAYRVDESTGGPFTSNLIETQIWFSHTAAGPNNLSDVFDNNIGPDETLVLSRRIQLSSAGTGEFDIVVDVDDVFVYNGEDNLLIEIRVFNEANSTQFDAAGLGLGQGGTDWTDRVWALDPNATSGSQGGDDGMVTRFEIERGGGCDPCPGDIDEDCDVDFQDLLILLSNWGPCPDDQYACENPGTCEQGFPPCNGEGCACFRRADGGGVCVLSATSCDQPLCPRGQGDCPDGWVCIVDSCCGEPVCAPPDSLCETGAAPAMPMTLPGTPTFAGIR